MRTKVLNQLAVIAALATAGCATEEYVPDHVSPDATTQRDIGTARDQTDIALDIQGDISIDVPSDARIDASRTDARTDANVRDVWSDARADVPVTDAGSVATQAACQAALTARGVNWRTAGASQGIAWPISITLPLNGIRFRGTSLSGSFNTSLYMDCRLGLALEALTRQLRDRWQVTEVSHMGIYNYRCIAGTDPCRLSMHSYALAIDLSGFRDMNSQTYVVNTDFTANGRPTCPPRYTTEKDRVLKEIACWMYDSRTFNIILTPNYNAAHRDHFHVDLTSGSHFVGFSLPDAIDPDPADPWTYLLDDD